MIVKILLFAEARDLVGADFVELEHGDSTTKEKLITALGEKFSELAEILPTCNLAYNHSYVEEHEELVLKTSDELAVIPPIGGG